MVYAHFQEQCWQFHLIALNVEAVRATQSLLNLNSQVMTNIVAVKLVLSLSYQVSILRR